MQNFYKVLKQANFIICTLSVVIYGFIRFNIFFSSPYTPKGDESSLLEVFKIFIEQGYASANIYGNSTVFNVISYPFYLITHNDLLSLRLTSLFSGFLIIAVLFLVLKRYIKLKKNRFIVAFLTALNVLFVSNYIFVGINDALIYLFTSLFFLLIFDLLRIQGKHLIHSILLGIVFGLLLSTRFMAIILFLPMVLIVFLTFKKLKFSSTLILKYSFFIVFSFSITTYVINSPSLHENGTLSFHSKTPKGTEVNWTQLQYLSAMGQDTGDLKRNKNYSWKQVEEYLSIHGDDSLPKTLTSALFWDIKLTLKEFFIDFSMLIIPFTRLIGVAFPLAIVLFLFNMKRENYISKILKNEILLFFIIYSAIISFVVITNIEPRWLVSILVFVPIAIFKSMPEKISIRNKNFTIENYIIHLQLISLTLMNSLYIYKVLL